MTLQQIMYFQRVARSGSFTKAARACFVSQTAISRQICALEEELHVTLLERDTASTRGRCRQPAAQADRCEAVLFPTHG